jgi:hypothetical protein
VLQLRCYAIPARAEGVRQDLAALDGVRHVVVGGVTSGGMTELTGEIDSRAADVVLAVLRRHDLAADDVTLWRATSVQPLGWRLPAARIAAVAESAPTTRWRDEPNRANTAIGIKMV